MSVLLSNSQFPVSAQNSVVGSGAIFGGAGVNSNGSVLQPSQTGVVALGAGGAVVTVANPSITINHIVVVTGAGAPDATATTFGVTLQPGVGFTILANAPATALKYLYYFTASDS